MASRLKADIESYNPSYTVELIESGGGVFEIEKEGELIFSKKKLGRFPESEEVLSQL